MFDLVGLFFGVFLLVLRLLVFEGTFKPIDPE